MSLMSTRQLTHPESERFQAPHVFVVRIWHEPREIGDAPPVWRGVVEYAVTKECIYFADMRKLADFILEKACITDTVILGGARNFVRRLWHTVLRSKS